MVFVASSRGACFPPVKLGLALATELAAVNSSSAVATVAAAISIPCIAYHGSFTAKADSLSAANATFSDVSLLASDAASGLKGVLQELLPILSVFSPKNLVWVFSRSMGLQLLLKFNVYMMQLLEHEKRCIEAEEQGRQVPESPPIPDFKPCFDRGLWVGCRELSVATVRKVYEMVAVKRMGMARAEALLRDHKLWIRDVLSVKYRLDPPMKRFVKYQFAVLHSSGLFYCADCTVAVILHVHRTSKSKKPLHSKAVTVGRGVVAQVLRATIRLVSASVGASLGSLMKPGVGTTLGYVVFDMGALAATAQITDLIAGEES